jgi:hypothetical protein
MEEKETSAMPELFDQRSCRRFEPAHGAATAVWDRAPAVAVKRLTATTAVATVLVSVVLGIGAFLSPRRSAVSLQRYTLAVGFSTRCIPSPGSLLSTCSMHRVASEAAARRSPLLRFLSYVAPHKWYIAGAALTGVLKFVIPLAFPLALKYLTDVVLVRDPHAVQESTNSFFERWCVSVLHAAPRLGEGASGRIMVVGLSMLVLYLILGVPVSTVATGPGRRAIA